MVDVLDKLAIYRFEILIRKNKDRLALIFLIIN